MNIKTYICAFAALAGLSSPAFSAVLVAWDATQFNANTAVTPMGPWSQTQHQLTSNLVYNGAITGFNSPNDTITQGWTPTINMNNFISFTVKPDPGYQLQLTSLTNSVNAPTSASQPKLGVWGYRIDTGSGYGDWVLSDAFSLANPGVALREWDFADFSTTGTVQFGLFGYGGTAASGRMSFSIDAPGNETALNGTVVPVPEASTALLGSLAGLALLRRRR